MLRHQGLDNFNLIGKYLLFLLKSNKFRVLITYFKHINYTICKSFNSTISPHMLENLSATDHSFVRLKTEKVVNIGMCNDHTAILTTFKITVIKNQHVLPTNQTKYNPFYSTPSKCDRFLGFSMENTRTITP